TSVSAGGLSGNLELTTAPVCLWSTTTSGLTWARVTGPLTGAGSSTVFYTVDPNNGAARTGTLLIAGRPFMIQQASGLGTIIITAVPGANLKLSGPQEQSGATYPLYGARNV